MGVDLLHHPSQAPPRPTHGAAEDGTDADLRVRVIAAKYPEPGNGSGGGHDHGLSRDRDGGVVGGERGHPPRRQEEGHQRVGGGHSRVQQGGISRAVLVDDLFQDAVGDVNGQDGASHDEGAVVLAGPGPHADRVAEGDEPLGRNV
eukprot:CAMPEP_0172553700 /NCGR_PEP_ID=MMETSP1067-20121228/51358_1 /TAXON_ID=265564 ORGANISM="Thalassiosira punctigera, Strain Tpunct2005C2" /NCGR_SAMPLE_ID=MMETSP1067 /ASSEMBLY_ACC=CAM_ASM_000444 /LENGTH=145 /DNA_ID=CAMNT_0013341919 /DNA_START=436 /DNA_END=873 /DNA_ORIENTATION=+